MECQPELSIVIVNFNTKEYTAQCIDSIYQNPPCCGYEIILVDNASTDDSVTWLEKKYPRITLVRSVKNVGIAGGNNLGIKASGGKFILFLNNDTLVLPESLNSTVEFLKEHPDAGGVGGNLLNGDGSFQSGYVDFPTLGQLFLITTKLGLLLRPYFPSHPRERSIREVDWMSTAFMAFRREAIFEVGLVDEDFFIYSDESDLQFRMKQAGWKIYYVPELETIHFGGKSLNPWRRRRMVYRGYLLFFAKHRSMLETFLLRTLFIIACLAKIPYWKLHSLFARERDLARNEIESNLSILKMCLNPETELPI